MCDVIVRNCSLPFHLNYSTRDTYQQHAVDLLDRLEMDNCLSHYSGVIWSRDIFKKPTQNELRRGNVRVVDVFNPNQTGFFRINKIDLSSMTLGSFQTRQGKKINV